MKVENQNISKVRMEDTEIVQSNLESRHGQQTAKIITKNLNTHEEQYDNLSHSITDFHKWGNFLHN